VKRVHGTYANLTENLPKINAIHFSGHGELDTTIRKWLKREDPTTKKEALGLNDE